MSQEGIPQLRQPRTDEWRLWSAADWNLAVLFFYFGDPELRKGPVARIVVTDTDLLGIVKGATRNVGEVQSAFVSHFKVSPRELNSLFSSRTARVGIPGGEPPDFVARLVFTCLAASGDESCITEGDFRKRIATIAGHDPAVQYPMEGLPMLWEALREWLAHQRRRGAPLRELILPDPGNMTRIGYSMRLAFPSRRDLIRLAKLLIDAGLDSNSAPRDVLSVIREELRSFSPSFCQAHREALDCFEGGEGLTESLIWGAVRAVGDLPIDTAGNSELEPRIGLILDKDGRPPLSIVTSRSVPEGRQLFYSVCELHNPVSNWTHGIVLNPGSGAIDPVEALFAHGLPDALQAKLGTELDTLIHGGFIVLTPTDFGLLETSRRLPIDGNLTILARRDRCRDLATAIRALGGSPSSAEYRGTGWFLFYSIPVAIVLEIGRFPEFSDTSSLCSRTQLPRLTIAGGISLDKGFFGAPMFLPKVSIPDADGVSLHSRDGHSLSGHVLDLLKTELPGEYKIPAESLGRDRLEGDYSLVAKRDGQTLAQRQIRLHDSVLRTDYKDVSDSTAWLTEGPFGQLAHLGESDEPSPETPVSEDIQDEVRQAKLHSKMPKTCIVGPYKPSSSEQTNLTDVTDAVCAMALRRKQIGVTDVLDVFEIGFGIGSPRLRWDIVRAWTENCLLEHLVARRWRGQSFRVLSPKLLTVQAPGSLQARLIGLVSSTVRHVLIERARGRGLSVDIGPTYSAFVPPAVVFRTENLGELEAFSDSTEVEIVRVVEPYSMCLERILSYSTKSELVVANRVPDSEWDWNSLRFTDVSDSTGVLRLLRHERDNSPDVFEIRASFGKWYSSSHSWALLVAHVLRGKPPFHADEAGSLFRAARSVASLPLHLVHRVVAASDIAPGPTSEGRYVYPRATHPSWVEVLDSLLPSGGEPSLPTPIDHWINAREARENRKAGHVRATANRSARRAFEAREGIPR